MVFIKHISLKSETYFLILYLFQVFQDPGFPGSRFFRVQVFQVSGFSGSGSRVQGPGPGSRVQGPGSDSRSRVWVLEVAQKWTRESRCSVKKLSSNIYQNSQENTCTGVSFSIKLHALVLQLYWKETWL